MKSIVLKVLGVIGALFLGFLVWSIVFNDGGVVRTAYNWVADTVNDAVGGITGTDGELLPQWNGSDATNFEGADGID